MELDWETFRGYCFAECGQIEGSRVRFEHCRTNNFPKKNDRVDLLQRVNEFVVYLENVVPQLKLKYSERHDLLLEKDEIIRKELEDSRLDPALRSKVGSAVTILSLHSVFILERKLDELTAISLKIVDCKKALKFLKEYSPIVHKYKFVAWEMEGELHPSPSNTSTYLLFPFFAYSLSLLFVLVWKWISACCGFSTVEDVAEEEEKSAVPANRSSSDLFSNKVFIEEPRPKVRKTKFE
jgi:hypothetical protein